MPLFRRTEFRYQQNGCGQQALGGVVEICVLPEGGGIHAGEDNGLGYDFGVFFRFRLIDDLVGMALRIGRCTCLRDTIYYFRLIGGISRVNNRNLVAVVLGDVSVVTHDIALGVGGEKGHPRSTGVLDARVQPKAVLPTPAAPIIST